MPERIFLAHRVAAWNRLLVTGMDPVPAERWCAAWECELPGPGWRRMPNIAAPALGAAIAAVVYRAFRQPPGPDTST